MLIFYNKYTPYIYYFTIVILLRTFSCCSTHCVSAWVIEHIYAPPRPCQCLDNNCWPHKARQYTPTLLIPTNLYVSPRLSPGIIIPLITYLIYSILDNWQEIFPTSNQELTDEIDTTSITKFWTLCSNLRLNYKCKFINLYIYHNWLINEVDLYSFKGLSASHSSAV